MQFGDGTGPMGAGPRTGWGGGWCRGPLGGRGGDERDLVQRQAEALETELPWVRARLDELSGRVATSL